MSERLCISSYRHNYSVEFVSDYAEVMRNQLRPDDYLIIDKHVLELHANLRACMDGFKHILIDPSEQAKSYEALVPIIQELIDNRLTKKDRLIAIGGGIVQDISAFTASILFRGVDWLFFPTNLLTQCDSCIGSKTSINFGAYKNQLGGFYPPQAVYIDPSFLSTLPAREIHSGLGEMMHYFLVSGDYDFSWASAQLDRAFQDREVLCKMIRRSLEIKKNMIERDEFDQGPRNVFNYGHSFGHALESATQYAIPHGIAVSYGMDLANVISSRLELIPMSLRNRIRPVLAKVWKDTAVNQVDCSAFCSALAHDKKNEGKEIKVILTQGIGQMFKTTLILNSEIINLIESYFRNQLFGSDL